MKTLDDQASRRARLIAFYLPQFYPIPENDAWWGKGFTEWLNVARARPMFAGHYQPHVPADLGYYDLRVPETRCAQAELAKAFGIEGFCYWHYWFAGKRLLERPFEEVLKSGKPDLPFCLAWANQSWTGIWHGQPNRILIEQTYPGKQDYLNHFYSILSALGDQRYIRVDGKPLFVVYMPSLLPNATEFTDLWNELAVREGLKAIYFVGIADYIWPDSLEGFDAYTFHLPGTFTNAIPAGKLDSLLRRLRGYGWDSYKRTYLKQPRIVPYAKTVALGLPKIKFEGRHYPTIMPNWDNTPRSGLQGLVLKDSSPELFRVQLAQALEIVGARAPDQRLVFIKSWNEWAEGNYLEPDLKFGDSYLRVIRDELAASHENSGVESQRAVPSL